MTTTDTTQSALINFYKNTRTINLLTGIMLILVVVRVIATGLSRLLLYAINIMSIVLAGYIAYSLIVETRRVCKQIPDMHNGSPSNKQIVTNVYLCYGFCSVLFIFLGYLVYLLF